MILFTPGRFNDLLMREPERCHVVAIKDDRALGASMEALGCYLSTPPVLAADATD